MSSSEISEKSDSSFNLSILECKCDRRVAENLRVAVLIYPYWNVNHDVSAIDTVQSSVLIYPYWNVNLMFRKPPTRLQVRFNLSILECKWFFRPVSASATAVLIYPYWNVNSERRKYALFTTGFNLSILECKFDWPTIKPSAECAF